MTFSNWLRKEKSPRRSTVCAPLWSEKETTVRRWSFKPPHPSGKHKEKMDERKKREKIYSRFSLTHTRPVTRDKFRFTTHNSQKWEKIVFKLKRGEHSQWAARCWRTLRQMKGIKKKLFSIKAKLLYCSCCSGGRWWWWCVYVSVCWIIIVWIEKNKIHDKGNKRKRMTIPW